jgi:hypothetical protein
MKAEDFTTVKLARDFVVWLKSTAATQQIPIYKLVERLAAKDKKLGWKPRVTLVRQPFGPDLIVIDGVSNVRRRRRK